MGPDRHRTLRHSGLSEDVLLASSLTEAFRLLRSQSESLHRIYIIGGVQLYKESMREPDVADRILLTHITQGQEKWQCDTFFPELKKEEWSQCSAHEHQEWLKGVDVPTAEVWEGEVSWRYEMWVRR